MKRLSFPGENDSSSRRRKAERKRACEGLESSSVFPISFSWPHGLCGCSADIEPSPLLFFFFRRGKQGVSRGKFTEQGEAEEPRQRREENAEEKKRS